MKRIKVISSLLLIFVVAIAACFSSFAVSDNYTDTINSSIKEALQYKQSLIGADDSDFIDKLSEKTDDFSVDWYYILLSRHSVDCSNIKSINMIKERVSSFYDNGLENAKATDMHRTALALISCGADIESVNGKSFLADCTYNYNVYSALDKQGVNGLAFALIVLDSKNYTVPNNAKLSRMDIVNQILDKELENGGFAITGSVMDVDVTAIVLQALAPYYDYKNVKTTVNRCLEKLSELQQNSGAYRTLGKENAESTAQVIIALTSLNINPFTDKRFIKNGNSTVDALLSFQQSNGGFCHIKGYMSDNIATYQSLCGLISCSRYLKGESRFFSYSAVDNTVATAPQNTVSVTEKATKKPIEPTETEVKKKDIKVKDNTKIEFKKPRATEKTEQTTIQETTVAVTNQTDGYHKINHSNYTQTETSQRTRTYDFTTGFLLLMGYVILFIVKTKGRKV